jgi:hypothetical protein
MNELNQNLKKSSSQQHKKKISFFCFKEPLAPGKRQRERDSFYYTIPRPLKERERERSTSLQIHGGALRRSFD